MRQWSQGEFSMRAWDSIEGLRQRIDELELLKQLAAGTLEPVRFVEYIVQDNHYLRCYARALSMLAVRAPDPEQAAFWLRGASETIAGERQLHDALLQDPILRDCPRPTSPSATTRGYANAILAACAYEPYPVAVAAVTPCYWIYADAGVKLAAGAQLVDDHPYLSWINTYASERFIENTKSAISLMERAARGASEPLRAQMLEMFTDASHYEELFWRGAYEREIWPGAK